MPGTRAAVTARSSARTAALIAGSMVRPSSTTRAASPSGAMRADALRSGSFNPAPGSGDGLAHGPEGHTRAFELPTDQRRQPGRPHRVAVDAQRVCRHGHIRAIDRLNDAV